MCANTSTIPSKTLREAAIYLTGLSERGLYGQSYRVKDEVTMDDRLAPQQVMAREIDVIRNQLARNHVRVLAGHGKSPIHTTSRSLTSMATRGCWRPAGS